MKDEAGPKGRSDWAKRWGSGDAVEDPEVWAHCTPPSQQGLNVIWPQFTWLSLDQMLP